MLAIGNFLLNDAERLFSLAERVRHQRVNQTELAEELQTIANGLILKHVELDETNSTLVDKRKSAAG